MTVNFVDPAKGVSTSALCTEAEAFDASRISIAYLVRRQHPSRSLAECSDTKCHDRKATEQALAEFIIEFANALAVIHHGYPCVGAKQLLRPLR
jgi:hypothetical protein